MNEKTSKFSWKTFLNNFEVYLGAIILMVMTALLFIQVVTRYVFGSPVVWTEEVSNILFIWTIYLGVSGAVLSRKHIKIDAVINLFPYKGKKILLIFANFISIAFCMYMFFPLMTLVENFYARGASTVLLSIPRSLSYVILPISMVLTSIRYVQESIVMFHEDESQLGVATPIIDLDAIERKAAMKAAEKAKEEEAN